MKTLKEKYGSLALIAGASEGIGAAYAHYLASHGVNLVLIARKKEQLEQFGAALTSQYNIQTTCIQEDLSNLDASNRICVAVKDLDINILIYNAGNSYIDKFENKTISIHQEIAFTNMITPLNLIHHFAPRMLQQRKGAI